MRGDIEGDPTIWIQPRNKLGNPIGADLVAAAQRNWKRVISYAKRLGQDASRAAEELEGTVHSLSSLLERHPRLRDQIKNLDDYVFWVAAHRLSRSAAKEPPVEYVGSLDDLNSLHGAQDSSWVRRLENDLVLEEITGYLNKRARYLFSLRRMGWSWQDIGGNLGISANAVEIQFNRGVARARRRILGRTYSKADRTPEPGRSE
jgi:DNA-directed RNA polymerase specialized sigma24 family protein